jgi:hypothetical protein
MKDVSIYKGCELGETEKKFLIHFTDWAVSKLKITTPFKLILCARGYGGISTGGYDPETNDVISRLEDRAPIDCARTIAHELVHLRQREIGKIKPNVPVQDIGGDIENEANAAAGVLLKLYAKEHGRWIYDL